MKRENVSKLLGKIRRGLSLICCLCLCLSVCSIMQVGMAAQIDVTADSTETQRDTKQFFPVEGDSGKYFTYYILNEKSTDRSALFVEGFSENFGNTLNVPDSVDGIKISDVFIYQKSALEEVVLADGIENIFCIYPEETNGEWGVDTNKKNTIKKIIAGRNFKPKYLLTKKWQFSCKQNSKGKYSIKYCSSDDVGYVVLPFENLEEISAPEDANYISVDNLTIIYDKGYKKLLGVAGKLEKTITTLTMHENCVEIGSQALSDIKSLEKIILGENVEKIGSFSFFECKNLKTIEFNEKLKTIDSAAFTRIGVENITFPGNVDIEIGDRVFYGCKKLTSVKLPQNITKIPSTIFSGCIALESVEIPKSVKKIGNFAFSRCKVLKEIVLPKGVKSIGEYAFKNCKSLKKIVIPKSVKTIGYQAFISCGKLRKITIRGKNTRLKKECIGYKDMCCDPAEPIKHIPTIVAPKGSKAQKYAMENKMKFKVLK